ncbi:MAG: NAD(P)-dependent glycerol-3-phosphate dehydrogenase [Spirochaetales bacterium]|nr:NAD(P)-dependent glycerol-3-phosphate dehydrogenase [Leptospiraceae bacterium]MCP5480244.1 NAD(P)-dependent glycerol-3-phosphate dehydrogenase [Spirochaetales bacterium]MCP5486357.1 NAD(P)-dependent glycerol-3-phosphate dehydrogenase [Spirochaetales bacterium]
MKVAVLGSGTFGTALASVLADKKDHDVTIWTRHADLAEAITKQHRNSRYFPDLPLPEGLKAATDIEAVLSGAEMVVIAIPAQQISGVLRQYGPLLPAGAAIVGAAKGVEEGTLRLVSEIFEEELPGKYHPYLSYLSGPSFAKEMIQRIPTVVSIASRNSEGATRVQHAFYNQYFRTYRTEDVIGVEVGGALKNVIAIAAGVSDGLGFGLNTRAALITRGLTEISRLGVAKGANPITFLGLAGMGDLVLTCTGDLSRNRTVGMKLGQGKKLKDALAEMNQVVEGVYTADAAYQLSQKLKVEMAITEQVYKLLYEDKDPLQVTKDLMSRDLKSESI